MSNSTWEEDMKTFERDTDHSTVRSILRTIDQMVASLVGAAWTYRNEGRKRGTVDLLNPFLRDGKVGGFWRSWVAAARNLG